MPLVQSMNFSITTGIRKKFLKLKAPYSITQNHDDFSIVVARLVHHPEFTLLAQHHDANDDGSISMFKWEGHQTWILVDRWLESRRESWTLNPLRGCVYVKFNPLLAGVA